MNPEAQAPKTWHQRRSGRILIGAVVLLLLYTVGGFWIAPSILSSQLRKQLPPLTHREVSVGTIEINPFQFTLTISNLSLTEPGGAPFLSWERFHADLELASIWRRAIVLEDVEITRAIVELERMTNGTFNFANLLPPTPSASQTNSPLPRIEIQSLLVDEGRIALRDRAIPGGFEKILGPVHLGFTNFSTHRSDSSPGRLQIVASTGEAITWDGNLSLNPIASVGSVKAGPFTIPRHGPYLNLATPATVASGLANVAFGYSFSWGSTGPDLVVSNASLHLAEMSVRLPGATTTNLAFQSLVVGDVSAGLAGKYLRVGAIRLADGLFVAQRGSDGSVDIAQVIRPSFVEATVQTFHNQLAGWRIEIPDLQGERLELRWGDEQPGTPVQISALVDRLQILGLSNLTNQPVTVHGDARWGDVGRMTLNVEATLIPATAIARAEFQNMRLPYLQPYVSEFVNLDVRSGTVDGRWTVQYNRQPGGPLISVEGGLEVNQFLAFDTQAARDFLKWESVQLRDVRGSWEPATVSVRELYLNGFTSSFVLMTNGQLNALALIRTNPAPVVPAPAASPAPAFAFSASLDRLTLTNASLVAADETVPGQFNTTLQRFSGSISDIAWPELKKSRVELSGLVGARAPFAVQGWVLPDPQRMVLDMHVTATNAELIPFTPYAIKFAGYPLKDGRVTADVSYKVDGRQVEGENHVVVDRLTLGPKASGKPLIDLPIRLGIALLKDSQGRITLDVPVRGSLDDPEFGVGKVVWQAIKGIFVKVATAPFKLLGSLFGGSEDDGQQLQTIEFAAGKTNLLPAATNRLSRLVTALNQRPELLVALRGGVSPPEDGAALARFKLDTALHQLLTNAPADPSAPPRTASTNELLFQLFTNAFPVLAADPSATAGTNATEIATPVPAPPPPSASEMTRQLLTHFAATREELEVLRDGRVTVVREWFSEGGRLAADRTLPPDPADTNSPPLLQRVVEFSLQ